MHGFAYKYISFKKIESSFKTFYTQFKTIKNDYNAKLTLFDLHTSMKIIQISICYLRMYVT